MRGANGPASPTAAAAVEREGWLARTLRAALSALLWPVVTPLRRELGGLRDRFDREWVALVEASARHERRLDELHRHAETRVDQTTAEIADLRGAFLTTRGEFERDRDHLAAVESGMSAGIDRLQAELVGVRDRRLPTAEADLAALQRGLAALQGEVGRDRAHFAAVDASLLRLQTEIEAVRDRRLPTAEADLAALQRGLAALQGEVEGVRDRRLARLEDDLARLHAAVTAVQSVAGELRDQRLPALAGRLDALVDGLHEEIAAAASLAERLAAGEGLRVVAEAEVEARVPDAVRRASVRFAEAFRGSREEILGRARDVVPLLEGAAPVLDLGCGRGELVEALTAAGIEARGVDSDPAMVEACRRLGLQVSEGEAIEALRAAAAGSLGGVCAIHVIEHMSAAAWMELVEASARVLRRGGVLLVESPNPDSLRVGAGLFWTDPTHRVPVHPDSVAFVVRAVGLEVVEVRRLRPFPAEQELARPDLPAPVLELAQRLDAWLSGPRDYLLVARKPTVSS